MEANTLPKVYPEEVVKTLLSFIVLQNGDKTQLDFIIKLVNKKHNIDLTKLL